METAHPRPCRIIVATATSPQAIAAAIGGLSVDGRVVVLGADFTQMTLNTGALIGKRTGLYWWPSGSSIDSEDTMKFPALSGVRPMTETFPLEKGAGSIRPDDEQQGPVPGGPRHWKLTTP